MAPLNNHVRPQMHDNLFTLEWLVGDALSQVDHSMESGGWSILFRSGCRLNIECLWRLRVDGKLISTNLDHDQQFGLPAPFDAMNSLQHHLGSTSISAVLVKPKTADIRIHFGSDIVLEVIQDSAGYEPWQAFTAAGRSVVALGSGELCLA